MQTSPLEHKDRVLTASFLYDFAVHGGAVGDISVSGDSIPANAVIDNGSVDIQTAVTSSGSATVAIKAVSAEDLLAATGKASLTKKVVKAVCATTPFKLSSAISALTFTVGTAALLTGKIRVNLNYVVNDA